MAFRVFDSAGEGAYFVVLIVSAVFCTLAGSLRLYASKLAERPLGLEDWLAAAAVVVFLIRVGTVLRCLVILNGRSTALADDHLAYTQSFQLIFVADVITMLDQSLAKWSVCALYYRIFGVNQNHRRWIWAIAILQGIVYIALVILQFLQCRPLHKFWQFWAKGDCMPFSRILVGLEPPNSVLDFALVVLALYMVKPLQLRSSAKWKLRFLFGLGSLAGVLGFVKIGFGYNPDQEYASAAVGLWAVLQSVACIVCCCAPVYKPLLPDGGFWVYLSSKLSPSNSRLPWSRLTRSSRKQGSNSKTSDTPAGKSSSDEQSQYQDPHQVSGQAWPGQEVGSMRWLVASEPSAQIYPMDSIQIHKSVDVGYDTASLEPPSNGQEPQPDAQRSPTWGAEAPAGAPVQSPPVWHDQRPYVQSVWAGQPPGVQSVPVWIVPQFYVHPGLLPHMQQNVGVYAAQPQPGAGADAGLYHPVMGPQAQAPWPPPSQDATGAQEYYGWPASYGEPGRGQQGSPGMQGDVR